MAEQIEAKLYRYDRLSLRNKKFSTYDNIGHMVWDRTLCRALVLLKQSPWLLGTILDGSPLRHLTQPVILPRSVK